LASFPFTGNISKDDLEQFAPGQMRRLPTYFAGGTQRQVNPYGEQGSSLLGFAGASAAVAAGFYGARRFGYNPLDYVYSGIRAAEDFSPGQVLRTFGAGDFLSQFTSTNTASRFISAEQIRNLERTAWYSELQNNIRSQNIGGGRSGLLNAWEPSRTGLTFRNNQLFAGDKLILDNINVMTSSGDPHLAASAARVAGYSDLPNVRDSAKLQQSIHFRNTVGSIQEESFHFVRGGIVPQSRTVLAEWIQRANRLAATPFELEPLATLSRGKDIFSVKAGTALPTLGRMAGKWGGIGTAAFLGYQTADWATRESSLLDETILGEGITAGVATAGIKANLLAAGIADAVPGLRSYQQAQEELAPGSTSLTKLAALPLVGALSGLTGSYISTIGDRFSQTRRIMKESPGITFSQALSRADPLVREESKAFASKTFDKLTGGRFQKKIPYLGAFGKAKQFGFMGAVAGAALALPFLPGALIPGETEDELSRIYSGEQEVAVRKGRFWEFGRTPYEGTRIQYFRPHWYPRMLQNSYEKSMGTEERSPAKQWMLENFTYDIEREHYYDRPYPVTGAAFEDIPIIGPMMAATLGQLVKPTKLMHTKEWLGSNKFEEDTSTVLRLQERIGSGVRPDRGDTPLGTPVLPGSFKQVLGEQSYRLTELTGLVGFSLSSIKKAITGNDEWFDQEERLQSARRMYGAEREYWDLQIGGGLGTTEFFRRLYPHRRRQIAEYNPIRNAMPDWLPGAGERSPDFQHGDPFTKVKEGELRLPGAGFAARFAELEGVDPEDYSDVFKYKILSDIAPYTSRTANLGRAVSASIRRGELTDREVQIYNTAKEQMAQVKNKNKSFYDYKVLTGDQDITLPGASGAIQSQDLLATINENISSRQPSKSLASSAITGYWEGLIKGAQNPLEALTPLAPASKFMHLQSAIEEYKRTQVYGSEISLWDNPIKNFILPFMRESADFVGAGSIPDVVEQERQLKSYFDILEYTKQTRLAEQAEDEGLDSASTIYRKMASQTLIGVNPYSRNLGSIYKAMPRASRDYFNAFSKAKNVKDRERIMELIPENEKRIYRSQWEMLYADELQTQMDQGLIPDDLQAQAQKELTSLYERQEAEGFPMTPDLQQRFQAEATRDQTYADWFRDTILMSEVSKEVGLPGPDWVGWHPAVDLDDIKLKVVQNAGLDIHDFDLWESDARAAAHRDFLDDATKELVEVETPQDARSASEVQAEIEQILADLGILGQVHVYGLESDNDDNTYKITLEVTENRRDEVRQVLQEMEA